MRFLTRSSRIEPWRYKYVPAAAAPAAARSAASRERTCSMVTLLLPSSRMRRRRAPAPANICQFSSESSWAKMSSSTPADVWVRTITVSGPGALAAIHAPSSRPVPRPTGPVNVNVAAASVKTSMCRCLTVPHSGVLRLVGDLSRV
eukprot:scaffold5523_cov58-Phaeocystis_antarctica.AAC.3